MKRIIAVVFLICGAHAAGQAPPSPLDLQRAATERQRQRVEEAMSASIDRQLASLPAREEWTLEPIRPAFADSNEEMLQPDDGRCEKLSQDEVGDLAEQAARKQGVNAGLIRAVIRKESAGWPCAVSAVGASGLMQLMPATASDFGVSDVFNPQENVFAGARLLRSLLDRYSGDAALALGAYNAGPATIDRWNGLPPIPETIDYVNSILTTASGSTTLR